MTVREFLDKWPENRRVVIYDKDKMIYGDIAKGVPFCLMGYNIKRFGAQPNYKITLYINTENRNA